MSYRRKEILKELSQRYFMFLMHLPFEDAIYMKGINEGKRKFLSNAHIYLATRKLPKKDRRYSTDFITPAALEIIKEGKIKNSGLQYEHIVPKSEFIQDVCEQKAMQGTLTIDFIFDVLDQYLWTATVTQKEHELLDKIPTSWDGKNILIRYQRTGIELIPHKLDYLK